MIIIGLPFLSFAENVDKEINMEDKSEDMIEDNEGIGDLIDEENQDDKDGLGDLIDEEGKGDLIDKEENENDFVLFTSKYDKELKVTNYYVLIVDQNYQSSEHQLTFEVSPDLTSCTNYSQIITTRDINVLNFSLNLPKSSLINDKFY